MRVVGSAGASPSPNRAHAIALPKLRHHVLRVCFAKPNPASSPTSQYPRRPHANRSSAPCPGHSGRLRQTDSRSQSADRLGGGEIKKCLPTTGRHRGQREHILLRAPARQAPATSHLDRPAAEDDNLEKRASDPGHRRRHRARLGRHRASPRRQILCPGRIVRSPREAGETLLPARSRPGPCHRDPCRRLASRRSDQTVLIDPSSDAGPSSARVESSHRVPWPDHDPSSRRVPSCRLVPSSGRGP